jgi:hypothetical protein
MRTKVEILGPEPKLDLTLEPFFRTREEARLIKLLQSVPSRLKYGVFFERHGCFRCGRRDLPHSSHALCTKCRRWAYYEFSKIEKELEKGELSQ